RGRIVSVYVILAADDHLVPISGADRNGRAPADVLFARSLPKKLAGAPVQRGNKRPLALVLVDDHAVLIKQRRAGAAVIERDLAEAVAPRLPPLEAHRQQASVAEVGIDTLAVGSRRGGSVGVLPVEFFQLRLRRVRFPQKLAVAAAKTEQRAA